MKKTIVLLLVITLVLNVCPLRAFATNSSEMRSIRADNGTIENYSVISEGNELLFSGEDLAKITGFTYETNGKDVTFSRGYKVLRVNLNTSTLYPLEGKAKLGSFKFAHEIQMIDSVYYFPASELLPWMNVSCDENDGILCVIADEVSIWDFIDDFFPEEFAFDYIECCNELGEDSKWLKTLAYIKANGLGMVLDIVPIWTDMTYGSFMDYYELFDEMFKNKESVTYALEELKDNNNTIQSAFDMGEELVGWDNLPEEFQMLSRLSSAFSAVSSIIDYSAFYSAFYQDNRNKLMMLDSIPNNWEEYGVPHSMVSAAQEISNSYKDIQKGIESKVIKAITEGGFDYFAGKAEGLVSALLAAIDLHSATSPDWSKAIDRISKYDMISKCSLAVYEQNKHATWISGMRDWRGSAALYLYACEQNWRAMAAYAHHKEEYALEQDYLKKAESALEWQGKFLLSSYVEINDSHAYGEGYAKTDYTKYLLSLFEKLDKYDPSISALATIEELMPLLELLDSFYAETYGAEVTWSESYYRVYENEDSFYNGDDPIAIKPSVPGEQCGEITFDPVERSLYVVQNFSSLAEWRDYLLQYMNPELVEEWIDDGASEFVAYNGILYLLRGGRGYGSYSLKLLTARLIYNEGNKCSVTVDRYFFDNYDCTLRVDFVWSQGKWMLENYTQTDSNRNEIDTLVSMSHGDIVREFIVPINEIYGLFNGAWIDAVDLNQVVYRDGVQLGYVKVTDPRFAKYSDFKAYVAQYLSDDIVEELFASDWFIQVGDDTYKMNDYGGIGSDITIWSVEYAPYARNENSVIFSACVKRIKPEAMSKTVITDNDLTEEWIYYTLEKINGKWVFTDYTPIG